MKALLCCISLLLALPSAANSLEASTCQSRGALTVAEMEDSEKLCRSFVRALGRLPEAAAHQAQGMLTPENMAAMSAVTAAWLGSQGVPVVGQAVDAALLALGVTLLAVQMHDIAEALWAYANLVHSARTEPQLDEASSHLARALATAGVNLVSFILTRKAMARVGPPPPAVSSRLSFASGGTVAVPRPVPVRSSPVTVIAADVAVLAVGQPPGPSGGANEKSGQPSDAEPGQWGPAKPSGSEASQGYQEQISGRPATEVYRADGVEFDGFKEGVLLEAKGTGYASFFGRDGQPRYWYRNSEKFAELMDQARRQSEVARIRGLLLQWHVAEAKVAGNCSPRQAAARTF